LEGLEAAGYEQGILKDIWKGTQDGEKEEPVARAARELQVHRHAPSSLRSGPYLTDFCISGARSMFQTSPISINGSSPSLMTFDWLGTEDGGRHWNWCLGITGGHRCQGMLAGMSPHVTCAFGPSHSDVL